MFAYEIRSTLNGHKSSTPLLVGIATKKYVIFTVNIFGVFLRDTPVYRKRRELTFSVLFFFFITIIVVANSRARFISSNRIAIGYSLAALRTIYAHGTQSGNRGNRSGLIAR